MSVSFLTKLNCCCQRLLVEASGAHFLEGGDPAVGCDRHHDGGGGTGFLLWRGVDDAVAAHSRNRYLRKRVPL